MRSVVHIARVSIVVCALSTAVVRAQWNFGGGIGFYSKAIFWTGAAIHARAGYFVNEWLNLDGSLVFQIPNPAFWALQLNTDAQFWVVNKKGIFYPFAGLHFGYFGYSYRVTGVSQNIGRAFNVPFFGINIGLGGGYRINDRLAITAELKGIPPLSLKFHVSLRYFP